MATGYPPVSPSCQRCYNGRCSEVRAMNDWSAEETDNPLLADDRNFYKVEKWSTDDQHIECVLWARNSLDKAREIFDAEVRRRPRGSGSRSDSERECCSAGRRPNVHFWSCPLQEEARGMREASDHGLKRPNGRKIVELRKRFPNLRSAHSK
jgi:hypothetical protein